MLLAGSQRLVADLTHFGGCRLGIMVDIVNIVTP